MCFRAVPRSAGEVRDHSCCADTAPLIARNTQVSSANETRVISSVVAGLRISTGGKPGSDLPSIHGHASNQSAGKVLIAMKVSAGSVLGGLFHRDALG